MFNKRIIPCLLVRGNGLVKTRKFKDPIYIGDPVNAVRIFSEKEVDEVIILDIDATLEKREPNYELISEIAGECFMPIAYGGGINSLRQVKKLIRSGVEKVVINSAACDSINLIHEVAQIFGSQAVVVGIDVRKKMLGGYRIFSHSATRETPLKLDTYLTDLVNAGAGEIFINSVDRDGTMIGYDLELIAHITKCVNIPVIAAGGAGSLAHLSEAIHSGASAASAGSIFVFYGKHKAVLINYPSGLII